MDSAPAAPSGTKTTHKPGQQPGLNREQAAGFGSPALARFGGALLARVRTFGGTLDAWRQVANQMRAGTAPGSIEERLCRAVVAACDDAEAGKNPFTENLMVVRLQREAALARAGA